MALLKGIVHQFSIYNIFSCLNKRIIFYKRSILIKQLWQEILEKIGCSKPVRPSTVIYITRTDFELYFSQLLRVRVVLSRWTFYKKCFFWWGTKKMLYIQNWWTIPLMMGKKILKVIFTVPSPLPIVIFSWYLIWRYWLGLHQIYGYPASG